MNTKGFGLRELKEDDLEIVLKWRNSDRIKANMYSDHTITLSEHIEWFKRIKNSEKDKYLIFEYEKKPIGLLYFNNIDLKNKTCYWGMYIGENYVPVKSGIVLEYFAMEYAFDKLGMRKLCGEIFAFNDRVIKLHKMFGFSIEGILKKHVIKNKKYEDIVLVAMFREHWEERYKKGESKNERTT